MLVVNLFGEPSAGKSVTSGGVFYQLNVKHGINAQVVQEVAKAFAWETPRDEKGTLLLHPIFGQQIFMLGEQNRGLERLKGNVDVAIMECPLLMSVVYTTEDYFKSFPQLALDQFNKYDNLNFVLKRKHKFQNEGRIHDESESMKAKEKLYSMLEKFNIPYVTLETHEDIDKEIANIVTNHLKNQS